MKKLIKNKLFLSATAIITVLLSVLILSSCSSLGTRTSVEDKARFSQSKVFNSDKGLFENRVKDLFERMDKRKKFEGGYLKFLFGNENNVRPSSPLPVQKPNMHDFLDSNGKIKIIWFGHSTFLLNFFGKKILIDPILTDYASPVPFVIGRFQPPPLELDELPEIDYVLISHDHYDHLDMKTVKFFRGKKTKFLVPLGVAAHLKGWGIEESSVVEFDWWQTLRHGGVEFVATPAQHFSGRTMGSRNETLWAGWIIKNEQKRIFYSGDTGYDTHFKDIGQKYGPFDLAFIENGQYNKRWEEVHLLPEQGVEAFFDLRAKVFFPVHWGTFKLSVHSWYEPIEKIHTFSLEKSFPLIAPQIGEIVSLDQDYKLQKWWQKLISHQE